MANEPVKFHAKARGLRRGDKRPSVRLLQQRLADLGYEPGPADGEFGYLTEDALLTFQREYRLRVDGIAGPQVWNALKGELPRRRTVHVVVQGERLSEIAERHQIGIHALRWMNNISPKRRLRAGDRLVIRSSYVLAQIASGASPRVIERIMLAQRRLITSIAAPPLHVGSDGALSGGVSSEDVEALGALAREGGWALYLTARGAEAPLAEIVCRRKATRRFVDGLSEALKAFGAKGAALELGPIPAGRSSRVLAAIARASDELAEALIVPVVDVPLTGWRSFLYDPDFEALARLTRHVVVGAHRWERILDSRGETLPREKLEQFVAVMARRIPPWKLLLGVPMNAWALPRSGRGEAMGYRAAVTEGYRRGIRAQKDANGYFRIDFPAEGDGAYARIVAPTRDVIGRYLAVAHRFRLDGIYLSGIGEEDRRLWEVCGHRLKAVRGE